MSDPLLAPHQPATDTAAPSNGRAPESFLRRLFPWDPIADDLKETVGEEPLPWVRFSLGRVFATSDAVDLIFDLAPDWQDLLSRHQAGDWGDVSAKNRKVNAEALQNGKRILSVYTIATPDIALGILTEADRSTTILLLPSELEGG